jgi:hypothetical protein
MRTKRINQRRIKKNKLNYKNVLIKKKNNFFREEKIK